ncbi:MAG TPA: TIGR00159 family protein [Elusimicrobia bacterium]|jgi:diadenylate cyclase|nr:TIGR00159 family protein [Elusimicrobiota bacterium]
MKFFLHLWESYLVHLVDILIVAYIFYRLILLIKGTRAFQVALGIVLLFLLTILTRDVIHLHTLAWLLEKFWMAGVVVLIVVFQPELRTALARLGSPHFGHSSSGETNFIKELIVALKDFTEQRIGALIVLEQETGLREFIDTGTKINGEVTRELLHSIFYPKSILHDGAVIIRHGHILAGGCILPVSDDPEIARVLGMRHRAALGLSEITDAWVIVVSEESGLLSLARKGELTRGITLEELANQLFELYRTKKAGVFTHLFQKIRT